jgi:hypothetical protein
MGCYGFCPHGEAARMEADDVYGFIDEVRLCRAVYPLALNEE